MRERQFLEGGSRPVTIDVDANLDRHNAGGRSGVLETLL